MRPRISTSLPDLDRSSDDASEYSERSKASTSKAFDKKRDTSVESFTSKKSTKKPLTPDIIKQELHINADEKKTSPVIHNSRKSIIDVLHQRVSRPSNKSKKNQKLPNGNEPKLIPQTKEAELLPTPGVDNSVSLFGKKQLFDTHVLLKRTRTENQAQKTKEIIREVFGGDDRPASAPPLSCEPTSDNESTECLTFDQKYTRLLEKMNIDFNDKFKRDASTKLDMPQNDEKIEIKMERLDIEDEETQDLEINAIEQNDFIIKEEPIEKEECDTPSVISERDGVTPTGYRLPVKKKKGNRAGRRKGSSGFDYIRKKKKPPPANASSSDMAVINVKRKLITYVEPENKDENDISREVKGWVLNKGVGESILHKASRLGYIVSFFYHIIS